MLSRTFSCGTSVVKLSVRPAWTCACRSSVSSPTKPAATCVGCHAWGVLPGRYCRACYTFGQLHQVGQCASCHCEVPIKKGYCRLCWPQPGGFYRCIRGHEISSAPVKLVGQIRHLSSAGVEKGGGRHGARCRHRRALS
ncbi:hypothetical protein [Streptosporangium sp. G12]